MYAGQGKHGDAVATYHEALSLEQGLSDQKVVGMLVHLGTSYRDSGHPVRAAETWQSALRMIDEQGFADGIHLRRSEVLPLTWAQVDFAGGFVRLEPGTTKNSEGRSFPLIPELRRLLERRQDLTRRCERVQGRIIPQVFHRYGRPIRSIRRTWLTACRKAGIPALRPHDLRRSAVRNLERAGVSWSVAMKLTGHGPFFPNPITGQPGIWYLSGQIRATFDAQENLTSIDLTGNLENLCPRLA